MVKGKKCPCGKSGTCPIHSGVKMVAYDQSDRKTVWYSFFREDRGLSKERIAAKMADRLSKQGMSHINVILFFDNSNPAKDPFEVVRPNMEKAVHGEA